MERLALLNLRGDGHGRELHLGIGADRQAARSETSTLPCSAAATRPASPAVALPSEIKTILRHVKRRNGRGRHLERRGEVGPLRRSSGSGVFLRVRCRTPAAASRSPSRITPGSAAKGRTAYRFGRPADAASGNERVGRLACIVADALAPVDGEDDELFPRGAKQVTPPAPEQEGPRSTTARPARPAAASGRSQPGCDRSNRARPGKTQRAKSHHGRLELERGSAARSSVDPPSLIEKPFPGCQAPGRDHKVEPDRPRPAIRPAGRRPAGNRHLGGPNVRLAAVAQVAGDLQQRFFMPACRRLPPNPPSPMFRHWRWCARSTDDFPDPRAIERAQADLRQAAGQGFFHSQGDRRMRTARASVSGASVTSVSEPVASDSRSSPLVPASQLSEIGHHDRKRGLKRQVALVEIDREHGDRSFAVAGKPRRAGRPWPSRQAP